MISLRADSNTDLWSSMVFAQEIGLETGVFSRFFLGGSLGAAQLTGGIKGALGSLRGPATGNLPSALPSLAAMATAVPSSRTLRTSP